MKKCRECGIELVGGKNWYPAYAKTYNYICIECNKAESRQYRLEHLEEHREYDRQYAAEHREEAKERARQWRANNRKKHRAYTKQWRKDNPEKYFQYNEAHREEQCESACQWAKDNPDRARENGRRRRARLANATIGPVNEAAIFERDGMCMYCGTTHKKLTIDHIVALDNGGPHCEDNVMAACGHCNPSKGTKPFEEWLQTQPYSIAWLF